MCDFISFLLFRPYPRFFFLCFESAVKSAMPEFNFSVIYFTLFAVESTGNLLPELIASVVVGASLFVLARTVSNTLHSEDLEQDEAWRYDVNRINELRRLSLFYRVFQPLIQLLARFNRVAFQIGRAHV